MKKGIIITTIIVCIIFGGVGVMYMMAKGEAIIHSAQSTINILESQIAVNEVDIQFGKVSLGAAALNGRESLKREEVRLKKVVDETFELRRVRDSIYISTPGTRIHN